METEKETQLKKFKIIEPFLRKEKKLKDIEKESGISYATLKRWIKAYKEEGVLGLDKKERQDKNSFRAVDDKGMDIIKKVCRESSEANISQLYDKCRKFLEEKEYNVSYPTFYRIVNNLDGFFKKTSRIHMKKIKKEHEVYAAAEIPLYILVKTEEGENKVPKILIVFDTASLEIINYIVFYEECTPYGILGFLRETILKASSVNQNFIKPKEILLDCKTFFTREMIKNIYDTTGIKILEYKSEEKKIDEFIEYLKEDIYKFYISKEKNLAKSEAEEFINSYIYLDSKRYSKNSDTIFLEKNKIFRELDVFLQSTKRKINSSSLRFRNKIYKDDILKEINGCEIEIKFNPLNSEKLYIFKEDELYGIISK